MPLKLYLVRGHELDGENQDVFAVADNGDEAARQWNQWCLKNGIRRDPSNDMIETQSFDPENVRLILEDVTGTKYEAGGARYVEWHELAIVC